MRFLKALQWLENFKDSDEFFLKESTNNSVISNQSINEGLNFEVYHPYIKMLYDEKSRFIVFDDKKEVIVNNYIINRGSNVLSKILKAYNFQEKNFNVDDEFYYRLLIPIQDKSYLANLLGLSDNYELTINENKLLVSIENSSKYSYLVVESEEKMFFSGFKHLSTSLIYAFGYLTGNLVRGEEMYFQTSDNSWEKKTSFFYREINKSVKCYKPINNVPQQYENFINDLDYDFKSKVSFLSINQLENLVYLIKENNNFFLSIRVVLELWNNSFITRPSVLFVALETLVDEILKKKAVKPYIDKILIKEDCIAVLKRNMNNLNQDDYQKLLNGLDNIDKNLTQNNKKFEAAFKALEIELSIEERKCLNKRNDFFHGKLISRNTSIKDEDDYVKQEIGYNYLEQRVFTLISKLILKFIGYNGFVINHAKLRESQLNRSFDNEDYFIKI